MDTSLSGHLRRRRRERGLSVQEAAAVLGICDHSLSAWETNGKRPVIGHFPRIIEYLGYEPWDEPQTLSEQFTAQRHRLGLTLEKAAGRLGVMERTLANWEQGRSQPEPIHWSKIDAFLAYGAPEAARPWEQ
jgi:DNA-binding transcriptional regulator YiaG